MPSTRSCTGECFELSFKASYDFSFAKRAAVNVNCQTAIDLISSQQAQIASIERVDAVRYQTENCNSSPELSKV